MTNRMLHRGTTISVKELHNKRVCSAIAARYPDGEVAGVVSIHLRVEWFRPIESPIYERVAEVYDEKLGSGFDNLMMELVLPYRYKSDESSWLVIFPNCQVEVTSNIPTELTIEHDNEELLYKWSDAKQDFLRSGPPQQGGRILFFPPGEVLLESILVQPVARGVRMNNMKLPPAPAPAIQRRGILTPDELEMSRA